MTMPVRSPLRAPSNTSRHRRLQDQIKSGYANGGPDIPQARMEREMSEHEQWQLTAEAAELYERYLARYILGPWAPLLVDAAHLTVGERVLDVACGTGVVARIAAQRVGPTGRVVGRRSQSRE